MSFDLIEDALITQTRAALTNSAGELVVRVVDTVPGNLRDPATLREMVNASHAVYWAFLGGRPFKI